MRRRFKPGLTRLEDFDAFWDDTKEQLAQLDPAIERHAATPGEMPGLHLEQISFVSLGQARITALLITWDDDQVRPLVVSSHGYGGCCRPRWGWARRGVNVCCIDVRGFGLSAAALPDRSRWGYVLTGIETPETSVIRAAVCDYVQAVRVARQLLGDRVGRTLCEGVSFAGGLALMAQAVWGIADLLALGVPTFGWAEGRNLYVKSGSGAEISHYLAQRPDRAEDTMLVLRYFDAVNFANRVTCPTLLALGLDDEVVPAKTVYGIANHLGGPYELMESPFSHSDGPEERQWARFEHRWLSLLKDGLPPGFGGRGPAG